MEKPISKYIFREEHFCMNNQLKQRLSKYNEEKVDEEMQTSGACEGLVPENVIGINGILPGEGKKKVQETETKEPKDHSDPSVPGKKVTAEKDVVNSMDTGINIDEPQKPVQDFFAMKNAQQQKRKELQAAKDEAFETKSETEFLDWCTKNLTESIGRESSHWLIHWETGDEDEFDGTPSEVLSYVNKKANAALFQHLTRDAKRLEAEESISNLSGTVTVELDY